MTEKQCSDCGEINPPQSDFCSHCGSRGFRDVPPRLAARLKDGEQLHISPAVRISIGRVVLVSALSGGLYLFYWFYLTWKQLATETKGIHHPVWHAFTLGVPIYGLFRTHAHVRVIAELASKQRVASYMAPGLAVVLALVVNGLGWASLSTESYGTTIVLSLISTVVSATLVGSAQSGLNAYWEKARGNLLADARIGAGEVVFAVLGVLIWIITFIPPSYWNESV